MQLIQLNRLILPALISSVFPIVGHAEGSELEVRIQQLEKTIQSMQQQRAEQDKQLELLTKELVTIGNHVSQSKVAKTEEKGTSKGNPVFATFKEGLVFEDGTGNWKMQLNGRVQVDYRTYTPDDWKNDTFSIRRARLGGTFSFLKDFTMRVEGEYANDNAGAKGTTALTYGYLDFTRWPGAKVRAGQFKPFFGLERAQSTRFTDFTELSLATNNGAVFTSTYDRGVMLFGDPLPWLNYNAYIVNGSGQNNDDVRDGKDIGARVNANLAKFTENKALVMHIGASASKGSIGFSTAAGSSLTQSTEGSGAQFFNVANILGTSITDRDRSGVEAALAYGPVKLQSEYIRTNFEGTKGTTHFDNDIKTWYADINWLITGEAYADAYRSATFGRIRPKTNFDNKDGWGAFEIGLRYSKFDASDFKSLLTAPTATNAYTSEADAWTAGAKWIVNPNARILLNYIHTNFDTDIRIKGKLDDAEKAVVLRAEYDF
ncbi:MAG: porin [Betaproteobacteria bacterium HGW-Betaproteobacteria-22]|nr:MAG: porin [Betaproteobacteria bacterium HGW-Betaproteobacteria-22]